MKENSEKVVGILGGMGPEATVDIFQKILRFTNAKRDQDHLHIIIDNNPKIPDRTESIKSGDRKIVSALKETAENIERAGADFIIMPCNTAHYFLDEIKSAVKIPIINMIEETVLKVYESRISPVGILATIGTLQTGLYQKELEKNDIPFILPDPLSQEIIMDAIINIKAGYDKKSIAKILYRESKKLKKRGAKAFILGCTEIPLAFPFERINRPVFDASTILARKAVDFATVKTE